MQVYSRVARKVAPPRIRLIAHPDLRERVGTWTPHIPRPNPRRGAARFRFLNAEHEIHGWNDSGLPKLWLYNLHYFDYPDPELIDRWIRENPPGHGNGWEPYPLSLRIVNWIKWALANGDLPDVVRESLAQQADFLARRIEHHLLANHLFANAKALVFAGAYFRGPWLETGLRILERELREQIFGDGGHFERSPMYHGVILEDLLDLINLGRVYSGLLPDWSEAASRMLGWLGQMTHPDGGIAFFNDAALGIAPRYDELAAYAARLGVAERQAGLSDSGYVRLGSGNTVVFFDAGSIHPDYQPGHAHAQMLSFELSHGRQRVLVNSGISTYENGPERLRQRGTAAHNTVRVDGRDQSEVWSAFRVARRARIVDSRSTGGTFCEAAHDGYKRLKSAVIHRRQLALKDRELQVIDTLEGTGEHEVEIFFHVHPQAEVNLQLDFLLTREEIPSEYYPEFGSAIPNKTIKGAWKGVCPVTFRCTISL